MNKFCFNLLVRTDRYIDALLLYLLTALRLLLKSELKKKKTE